MKGRTVFLHIGQTKTATTTLQAFFHANRRWLAEHGVLYPDAPEGYPVVRKHRFLVDGLRAKGRVSFERCGRQWDHLLREIGASAAPKVLLSEEVLWHLFEEQPQQRQEAIAWMAGRLAAFDVKIICYLRRQDRWIESYHNQIIKTDVADRATLGIKDFAERYAGLGYFDYAARLDEWASAFGEKNIIVRPFERGQFGGGDILQDFCAQLGIGDLAGAEIPEDKQVSLSNVACELAECFNSVPESEACKREFLEALREFDAGRKDDSRYLPSTLARKIVKEWEAANQKVAWRFLGREQLFLETSVHDRKQDYQGMSVKDVAALALQLFVSQQAQIDALKEALEQRPAEAAERRPVREARRGARM